MRKALRWRNWKEKRGERERSCRRLCDEQISERENLKEEEEEEEEEGEEEDESGKRESEQEEEEEEGMIWYRVEVMQGKCRINRSGLLSPAERSAYPIAIWNSTHPNMGLAEPLIIRKREKIAY